jgi:WD40 repeat protein
MFHGHQRHADCVAFTTDGKRIAAGGADGTVRIWDTVTRAELRKFQVASSWVKQIAFSPNGRQLVIGDHDGRIRIWDAPREFETQTLTGDDAALSELAFSLDSTQLSCRDSAGRTICWKYSEGQWSRAPKDQVNPDSEMSANIRSPDGRWLAIPYENSITLVDQHFKSKLESQKDRVRLIQPIEH